MSFFATVVGIIDSDFLVWDNNIVRHVSIIYNNKKSRNPFTSFILYLRDCLVYFLPINKLPSLFRIMLYGDLSYVFFIHPRRSEDYFLGLPFLSIFRKLIPKRAFIGLASKLPPAVISNIDHKDANGVVMSSLILPELLMKNRKQALSSAVKAIRFANKITQDKCIIGLGAWWPIISNRGIKLHNIINDNNIIITNGHMGTLLSIYSMIVKISNISNINMSKLKICIIGAGKMGTNVATILYGKVNTISLLDIQKKNIDLLINNLNNIDTSMSTIITSHTINNNTSIRDILNHYHLGVCVTSNLKVIIKNDDLPNNFIVIDDSRPEAISRKSSSNRNIIIEGGLMKILNSKTNYDYGFGIDQNVFGCLAETYALAIDKKGILQPSLGNVDNNQFDDVLHFYHNNGIEVGDFKTGDRTINQDMIISFMKHRDKIMNRIEAT